MGPFKALGRSYRLIQGRWWATFALLIVCYLLVSVISGIVQFPLLIVAELVAGESALANGLAQGVGTTIGFAITYPYLTAILTILYFDQRVRKEGFDLQLMARGPRRRARPERADPAGGGGVGSAAVHARADGRGAVLAAAAGLAAAARDRADRRRPAAGPRRPAGPGRPPRRARRPRASRHRATIVRPASRRG